eukprot:6195318-Pleurochrysis_carterae.AAC.2
MDSAKSTLPMANATAVSATSAHRTTPTTRSRKAEARRAASGLAVAVSTECMGVAVATAGAAAPRRRVVCCPRPATLPRPIRRPRPAWAPRLLPRRGRCVAAVMLASLEAFTSFCAWLLSEDPSAVAFSRSPNINASASSSPPFNRHNCSCARGSTGATGEAAKNAMVPTQINVGTISGYSVRLAGPNSGAAKIQISIVARADFNDLSLPCKPEHVVQSKPLLLGACKRDRTAAVLTPNRGRPCRSGAPRAWCWRGPQGRTMLQAAPLRRRAAWFGSRFPAEMNKAHSRAPALGQGRHLRLMNA